MLRDKSLIPLSHQHQRALALCVRIDRAQPIRIADLEAWQAEIAQEFEQEIKIHFAAEEQALFPAARQFSQLLPLTDELIADHERLRKMFSEAAHRTMSTERLRAFAQELAVHIRKEERQFFQVLQGLMSATELAALGSQLQGALKEASQTCIVPNESTKLRPHKST